MMGLRLVDGMPESEVAEILALGARGPARTASIARAESAGLLERAGGMMRFTPRGMMTANTTLAEFA
jgi:coproporphyrinogen III oxidase-like Fe-S oxidoreductase